MKAERDEFADLEIRVSKLEKDGYPVEVTLNQQQVFERVWLAGEVQKWVESADREADGRRLWNLLFADQRVANGWERAWGEAAGRPGGLRVRLRIDPEAPELYGVPWELLQQGETRLAAQGRTPFSRYLAIAERWGVATRSRPVKVLVAISNPTDLGEYGLAPVAVERVRARLEAGVAGVAELKMDFLEAPVTMERIEARLREGYAVFHFVGHGEFSPERQRAALYLQDDEGDAAITYDKNFVNMIARQGVRPQLVFLSACQSASGSEREALSGLGPRLVQAGVPAVVAMQGNVSMESAERFGEVFYRQLMAHGVVDLAMNEARSTLVTLQRWDTEVPILFMRLEGGQLWKGGVVEEEKKKAPEGEGELKAYFRALAAECGELPLGLIDEKFTGKAAISLKDVYIDLDVLEVRLDRKKELHLLRRELERAQESRGNQRVALIEAIAAEDAGRMVLLGAAGSGKTTFSNYLTYVLANAYAESHAVEDLPETLKGLLPVRLVLRKAAAHIPVGAECGQAEMLWKALEEEIKGRLGPGYGPAWERIQKEMREGRSLVLLDGLDEVAEAGERRACLLEAVEDFLKGLPKRQRVVLTARPYAYADPKWQLRGCEVFNLAPLSPKQVGRFVERWYLSVRGSVNLDPGEATRRAGQLAAAIKARAYLADLASRPLLLTLMAALHSTGDDLPEDRADLYEKTVHLLLVRWQRGGAGSVIQLGDQAAQVDLTFIRRALAELAYQTQERQRGTGDTEGAGDISFGELLAVFVKRMPKILPGDLAAYLENRTGLLVEREPGMYCFAHRSFQEYLAACHLLDTSANRGADLRKLVAEDAAWWREVILLAMGKARQGGEGGALELVQNALLPMSLGECLGKAGGPGEVDWRAAVLGGQALAELRVLERQPEQAEAVNNVPRARKWLVGVMERSGLPARERVEAGNLLAGLGDERFDPEHWYLPKDEMMGFVRVPGGEFWMGSDPKRDGDAQVGELPQHKVEVAEFYIQRYPVTGAQFGVFVARSGYKPEGRGCLDGVGNHPVVNVTWDDAVAYCEWLEGELRERGPQKLRGWQVRLPSEAEWEKAARGTDGRIYPWGDEFDPDRANTSENGIDGPSPVGSFPGGASPYGVLDMSGNVWEWCADWWDEEYYRKSPSLNPPGPKSGKYRVLRGGSFRIVSDGARCAFRYRNFPDSAFFNFGFRVGCSPFFSR